MNTLQPLAVISAVPRNGNIVFKHPTEEIVVESHADLVWEVLYWCDGLNSIDAIVSKVKKALKWDASEVRQVINDLVELGVLADSRQVFSIAHALGNNLSPFVSDMSPEEIAQLQESPHKSFAEGKPHLLQEMDAPSNIKQLGALRASCRSYKSEAISVAELGEILVSAYSAKNTPVPSAGALEPLKIYAILLREIGDMPRGLYEYNRDNVLICLDENLDMRAASYALNSDDMLHNAPVILVIAGDMYRQATKYANRAYRYTVLEAGHVAQNIHLSCVDLGLASLEYGGFQDEKLRDLFGMDNEVMPIVLVAVGHQNDDLSELNTDDFATILEHELVGKNKPVNWVRIVNSPSEDEYSFFHAVSHFRSGSHDIARESYAQRHCGGTGYSSSAAKLKAIAEGYERYASGQVRFDVVASANELDDQQWLDPRIYAPYTPDQLVVGFQRQFVESDVYEWVSGERLSTGESVLVPIDMVFYPLSSNKLGRELCHFANSSGIAAHATREKAVQSALLELIERDAVLRSWYTQSVPRKLSSASLDAHWQQRAEYWQQLGYSVEFLDLSDNGVTIIMVVIHSENLSPHFVSGTAASIEGVAQAIEKAFQEAELSLIVMRSKQYKTVISPNDINQPEDHGTYYAQAEHYGELKFLWSAKPSSNLPSPSKLEDVIEKFDPVVVDVANSYPRLNVVRVFARDLLPIGFGYGNDHFTHHTLPDKIRKRSISDILPHYLA